jgi:iron complex transport system substrate-binding protein
VPAWAQAPQRVVTVNLCLDQLALRLAAPGQLVGVSYLSHDPQLSVLADEARAVAPVRADVESILALRPDLVVLGAGSNATQKRLLQQMGVPLVELPWAASPEESEALIARMASALGREAVGAALLADLRRQRGQLAWTGAPTATAAVLAANGATSGKGSLMDGLLRLAGFRNLAGELGIGAFGLLPLETVVAHQPELLVLDGAVNDWPSRATEFVGHAALRSMTPRARIVSLPMRFTLCAGPENMQALRLLAEARR